MVTHRLPSTGDAITDGMAQVERSALRTLAEMALQEQAERRLTMVEYEATVTDGWHKVKPAAVAVNFCRGGAGQHTPHLLYMVGVATITREQAVFLVYEALAAVAKAEVQG